MVDKKAVVVATVIALVLFGIILGLRIKNLNSYEYKETEETNVNQNTTVNSTQENETTKTSVENKVDENVLEENNITENTIAENTVSENKVDENTTKENTTTSSSTNKKTEKDPEKLAISLVKEKWGNINSNVYFDVEDKNESKGIYTIVVRDNSTTVEIATYKVDINKKTVTE